MITQRRHGSVLEIRIDHPPVNALSTAVRRGLADAFAGVEADPGIEVVIIAGGKRAFSAGADLAEFGVAPVEPDLPSVLERIEACSKPVVALIEGVALGGGLELALACHYRLAAPTARLGLPEVKLGLLPGAGGTQRLPRLIGVGRALDMIVSGDAVTGRDALAAGLVDALLDAPEPLAAGLVFARGLQGPRPLDPSPAPAAPALFDRFADTLARKTPGLAAPAACLEAVRAATVLPFDEGMKLERKLFLALRDGEQSRALRHVFNAERRALRVEGLRETDIRRPIGRVGIVGAGAMGSGIALAILQAGLAVDLLDIDPAMLARGAATIRAGLDRAVSRGRLTAEAAEQARDALTEARDYDRLSQCDLIIEAAFEDLAVKTDIFARIDAVARPGAVLATNTSYLDIDLLASATRRPGDVVGLHFFSPAQVMKLLEIVRGARTDPAVLATALEFAKSIGKQAVVASSSPGFIANRMMRAGRGQAETLLVEGADIAAIDEVYTALGLPMGPLRMSDLAGVDVGWHRDPSRIETIRDCLCARGRFGQKSGGGFYDYADPLKPSPSAAAAEAVAAFRAASGVVPRTITREEILARTLYVIVNEGWRVLEEGVAQRASDIDVAWIHGYGWPRWTGGPMYWSQTEGLDVIARSLQSFKPQLGRDFVFADALRPGAASGV